jgi:hypothetical protein
MSVRNASLGRAWRRRQRRRRCRLRRRARGRRRSGASWRCWSRRCRLDGKRALATNPPWGSGHAVSSPPWTATRSRRPMRPCPAVPIAAAWPSSRWKEGGEHGVGAGLARRPAHGVRDCPEIARHPARRPLQYPSRRARSRCCSTGAEVGRTAPRPRQRNMAVEGAVALARRPSGRTDDRGQGGGVQSISPRGLSLGKRGHSAHRSSS